jgi:putative peptidoglycan lipid II flippase
VSPADIDIPLADPITESQEEKPITGPRRGMLRSSMIFTGLSLISKVLGLARDLVISAKLGASGTIEADAYNTMLSFPNLFRRIFAEGAFANAFVPAYARALARDGEEAADILATDAMATLAAMTIALTIAAQLAMPWLMFVINPGYHADKYKLAVLLTQIGMPYLPCMAIYAHLSGVLNARGRFILSALAPTLLNVCMLVAVLPQKNAHAAAMAASGAVVVAGISQAALLTWGVRHAGGHVIFRLPRWTPDIRALLLLAVPGAIAGSGTQLNIFISNLLSSYVPGARSWLAVCDRLYQLPMLIGVAVGVALLPRMSRAIHSDDATDAQAAMDQAIVFSMAFALPAAAALMAMPFYLIDGLFTRGAFNHFDASQTAVALFQYGWGVPAFVLKRIIEPAFYARQDTRSPMRFTLISIGVNIGLSVVLFKLYGVGGIAAATSIATWINVAQLVGTLAIRGWYRPSAGAIFKLTRTAIACVVLGAGLVACTVYRPLIEAPLGSFHLGPLHAKEITVLAIVAAAALVYPLLLLASGGITVAEARGLIRRRAA